MRRAKYCSAFVLVGALALPAHAATPGVVVFTDPTGDANGINGQSFTTAPSQSTSPAAVASEDIVGVRIATFFKKKGRRPVPNGFSVTLTLAAAPDNHADYMVTATAPSGCGAGTSLDLQYDGYGAVPVTVATCGDGTTTTNLSLGPAVLDATKHTIIWSVDGSGLKAKTKFTALHAATTVLVLGQVDEASTDAVYSFQ